MRGPWSLRCISVTPVVLRTDIDGDLLLTGSKSKGKWLGRLDLTDDITVLYKPESLRLWINGIDQKCHFECSILKTASQWDLIGLSSQDILKSPASDSIEGFDSWLKHLSTTRISFFTQSSIFERRIPHVLCGHGEAIRATVVCNIWCRSPCWQQVHPKIKLVMLPVGVFKENSGMRR